MEREKKWKCPAFLGRNYVGFQVIEWEGNVAR